MSDRADEQLLRSWLGEPVWLPESDLGPIAAYAHQTPQQRGFLPPLHPRGFARMLSATKLIVAGIVIALFGGFLFAGGLSGGTPDDAHHAAPAAVLPTDQPDAEPPALIAPTDPSNPPHSALDRPKKVHWKDGGITFDARDFRITVNGRTYGPRTPESISGHISLRDGKPREGEIEADWSEDGAPMRLALKLGTSGGEWWITHVRNYGGTAGLGYFTSDDLKAETRTPIGDPIVGDIDVETRRSKRNPDSQTARVEIDGLRLMAYVPGTIPTPALPIEYPRMIVEYEHHSMLRGQSQRITAKWCLGDACWPASDAKWSTDTPKVIKLEPSSGSWTRVTALKPGRAGVRLRAPRYDYHGGVTVHPRPGKGTNEERYGEAKHARKVVVTPRDTVLKLGQYVVLTGWRCPTKGAGQLGPDGQAGTNDDGCETEDLLGVRSPPGSGMAHVGTFGPSTLMLADSFELDDDDIQFAGVFVTFPEGKGRTIVEPNLYIRETAWRGPYLGDLEADGDTDVADRDVLADVLDAHGSEIPRGADGWDDDLDINEDHRLDSVDLDIVDALARAHAGELVPTPAEPYPTDPPHIAGPRAIPSSQPAPPSPVASPEP